MRKNLVKQPGKHKAIVNRNFSPDLYNTNSPGVGKPFLTRNIGKVPLHSALGVSTVPMMYRESPIEIVDQQQNVDKASKGTSESDHEVIETYFDGQVQDITAERS